MISWGVNHEDPWILLGDFNSTLSLDERQGGLSLFEVVMDEFISCTTTLGLEDVSSFGNGFTWTNSTVWFKIDRVLVNNEWHTYGFRIMAEFLPFFTVSDHTAMMVSFVEALSTKSRLFKFLNLWMNHLNFLSLLRENWHMPIFGTKQYVLCMKLKHLKGPLKTLHYNAYSYISERVKPAQHSYSETMAHLMNNSDSESLKVREKEDRKQMNFLLEAENHFFQLKLKIKHLTQADRSSKFFHSFMRNKNASSFVPVLVKSDGSITTSQEEVIKEFLIYYKALLGSDPPVSTTSDSIF